MAREPALWPEDLRYEGVKLSSMERAASTEVSQRNASAIDRPSRLWRIQEIVNSVHEKYKHLDREKS